MEGRFFVTRISTPITLDPDRSHPTFRGSVATMRSFRERVLAGTIALSVAGSLLIGTPAAIGAQDGTGGATPTPPNPCSVQTAAWSADLAIATPTPTETAIATATPVITSATPIGSPAASPNAATPVTTPTIAPTATPSTPAVDADAILADDLRTASIAVLGCLRTGDADTLVQITSDAYRGALVGIDGSISADDYKLLAASLSILPYDLASITDVTSTGDTTATATVTYLVGQQVRSGTWEFTLTEVGGTTAWVLTSETLVAPTTPENVATVDVTLADNAFTLSQDTISASDVLFSITNEDEIDHEFFVVQLGNGTTTQTLLTSPGPQLPNGVMFVGQVTIPASGEGQILLADLEPGTYAVVDLLPDEDGLPHLSTGMETTFTID